MAEFEQRWKFSVRQFVHTTAQFDSVLSSAFLQLFTQYSTMAG